jgi:hypothetical protein
MLPIATALGLLSLRVDVHDHFFEAPAADDTYFSKCLVAMG